ncbi:MAG: cytochrome c5 family protein [Halioglobus sp.]
MSRSSVLLAAALVACLPISALAGYPEFTGEGLEQGRSVWVENCEGCHAYSIAGAPLAGDQALWAPRIAKGTAVLYDNAINGFFGPGGTMMPARGGNDSLSDVQVQSAVDYMIRLAQDTEPSAK